MRQTLRIFLFLLIFPFQIAAQTQTALSPELEIQANEIFDNLLSPFCPGRLLQNCPSTAASELKERIRQQLAQGKSEEEVFDYVYGLYGEEIRAAPKRSGFGLVAWIAPACFLVVGLAGILGWLRSKQAQRSTESAKTLDPKISARIESEILGEH